MPMTKTPCGLHTYPWCLSDTLSLAIPRHGNASRRDQGTTSVISRRVLAATRLAYAVNATGCRGLRVRGEEARLYRDRRKIASVDG